MVSHFEEVHGSQQIRDHATSDASPANGEWLIYLKVDFNGLDCPFCGESLSRPAPKNEHAVEEATNKPISTTRSKQRRLSQPGKTVRFSDPSSNGDQSLPSLRVDSQRSSLAVTSVESPMIPIVKVKLRARSSHRHVARHFEEFALTALPRMSGDYDSDVHSTLDGSFDEPKSDGSLGDLLIPEQPDLDVEQIIDSLNRSLAVSSRGHGWALLPA